MVYSAVLVSGVLQSQSVTHMHISTLSSILFPYTPLQGFEQDFLRYTAGPYQSSISSIVLCIREEAMAPTPVLLPGKSQGRRSLLGCNPWGHTESGTTERLHFHFSFHALEKAMAPTPVFLPGDSQGRGSLVGCRPWGRRVGQD